MGVEGVNHDPEAGLQNPGLFLEATKRDMRKQKGSFFHFLKLPLLSSKKLKPPSPHWL